jgi:hypothetical protein
LLAWGCCCRGGTTPAVDEPEVPPGVPGGEVAFGLDAARDDGLEIREIHARNTYMKAMLIYKRTSFLLQGLNGLQNACICLTTMTPSLLMNNAMHNDALLYVTRGIPLTAN